jgi:cell wall-associated NlpC family hydrolase
MTKMIIRRIGSALFVVLTAGFLMSSTPATSNARRHAAGHGRRSQHSASQKGKRYAKLSRKHHATQHPLTSAEKQQMIEKIQSLASNSTVVSEDSILASKETFSKETVSNETFVGAEAGKLQIALAEEAKEQLAEDTSDVSIEQFFKMRPGAVDGQSVDPNTAKSRQEDFALFDEENPGTTAQRSDIMEQIIDWLGTRYSFGGDGRGGIDCSAFTRAVFVKAFGVTLPRTAFLQHELGESVSQPKLKFGDLVFFHTASYSPVSHVGVYIGEGLFANASCSRGVSIASLSNSYWSKRFIGGKRLFTNSQMAESVKQQIDQMAADENTANAQPTDEN